MGWGAGAERRDGWDVIIVETFLPFMFVGGFEIHQVQKSSVLVFLY